jgi:hypothetical protein
LRRRNPIHKSIDGRFGNPQPTFAMAFKAVFSLQIACESCLLAADECL